MMEDKRIFQMMDEQTDTILLIEFFIYFEIIGEIKNGF